MNATWPPSAAFVRQVRMGKSFRTNQPTLEKLSGLVIESLWYAAITTKMSQAATVTALDHAAEAVMGKVYDPTGVDDLAKDWTPSAGSITSTGRAVTSQRGAQTNRPARSWRTR
ncbi:hypothetical protein [Micromonospora sp. NPDC048947]|uniref:hypothetical protein n=1 Tax=Micromonospora sp. NPDC048947 TaxID=3154826 RepID=UPI0033D6E6D3